MGKLRRKLEGYISIDSSFLIVEGMIALSVRYYHISAQRLARGIFIEEGQEEIKLGVKKCFPLPLKSHYY